MENLSTPLPEQEKMLSVVVVGGKPWLWMLLFSLLQMGASSSRITLLSCISKNWDMFDPQRLKNPLYEGFLYFKRRPHLPREEILAGTTPYQFTPVIRAN